MSGKRFSTLLTLIALAALCLAGSAAADTVASLLGNFTINQFAGVQIRKQDVDVHYVVVMGQLPALKALHDADSNADGVTSQAERDAYLKQLAPDFARKLQVREDGRPVPLHLASWHSSLPSEAGGFSLRLDAHYAGRLPAGAGNGVHKLRFRNSNYDGRIGWHEIVVAPADGISIFNTNGVSTSVTRALSINPQKLPPGGPLDERAVHLAFTQGPAPAGVTPLQPRPGYPATGTATAGKNQPPGGGTGQGWMAWIEQHMVVGATAMPNNAAGGTTATWLTRSTKRLVDLISPQHQGATGIALLALLIALVLGALHAFSPGHGKTVVGAYLVGSRGTIRHAVFLGLTVTVTHTAGVFALGFATLLASQYVVPEKLFPILSLISGLLVVAIGATMLVNRYRALRGHKHASDHDHAKDAPHFRDFAPAGGVTLSQSGHGHADTGHSHGDDDHNHGHDHPREHSHDGTDGAPWHSHGGKMHSHLPPEAVSWKSLLALGVSGGLIPCPSAMVLLLAAIAVHKTVYGMILVLAFSVGLAITLTAVGVTFLYARRLFQRRAKTTGRWLQILPMLSAGAITGIGLIMCYSVVATVGTGL